MTLVLAGDIGGTKTLLQLIEKQTDNSLLTLFGQNYPSHSFGHLNAMVHQFLEAATEQLGFRPQPKAACFGIAGPVVNQTSELTNLGWFLDRDRLSIDLQIPQVTLINDFAAVGYGVLGLQPVDLLTLQSGIRQERSPIGIIGAGTGLGECFLTWSSDRYEVYASEGGHVDFAPRSALEVELLDYLLSRHERVSVERVVSGLGIVAIYQFLRDRHPDPNLSEVGSQVSQAVQSWEQGNTKVDAAAAIANAAMNKSDRLSEQTMQIFVQAYGAEAGNLALKLLPYGGLYIAGGIATKILPLLEQYGFLKALKHKGRVSPLLDQIPIHIVRNPNVGMIGAALYATSR
jgi:glucokinase